MVIKGWSLEFMDFASFFPFSSPRNRGQKPTSLGSRGFLLSLKSIVARRSSAARLSSRRANGCSARNLSNDGAHASEPGWRTTPRLLPLARREELRDALASQSAAPRNGFVASRAAAASEFVRLFSPPQLTAGSGRRCRRRARGAREADTHVWPTFGWRAKPNRICP